jgi:hypothetical protein
VSLFGVRATLVGAGVIGAVATFGALFLPGIRTFDRHASSGPVPRPAAGT